MKAIHTSSSGGQNGQLGNNNLGEIKFMTKESSEETEEFR